MHQHPNNSYMDTRSIYLFLKTHTVQCLHKTLCLSVRVRELEIDSGMKGWNDLGVVGTIFEEEEDENSALSSSFSTVASLESSPSKTPHLSRLEHHPPWQSGRRHDPDVVIHVQGTCFRLHKQALIAKSAYLKRQLAEMTEITLSPPLNITAQTFALVTEFCYGTHVSVTPFNVAALRTAAELLGMAGTGGDDLKEITEAYFRRVVAVNKECASIVLRSCFPLLPESEAAAGLVSRCIEALSLTASGDGDGDAKCLEGLRNVEISDLKLILESVSQRLADSHDFLYRIIDIYLKENMGSLREEEKIQMCNYIDCSILSPKLLMHAVQNPRMPLRFVVQAMFLQQLNTRHSIISSAAGHRGRGRKEPPASAVATLGAILKKDAAQRQVSQLKAVMTATSSRIQTLEEELTGMRQLLGQPQSRSASFRFSSEDANKLQRGQLGSFSSLSYRDVAPSSHEVNFGRRLMNGLRSAFRLQKNKAERKEATGNGNGNGNGDALGERDIIIIRKNQAFHKRSRSQV
ncbi:BTB/POZ domain-containing protein At3g49900-like [Salvia splendens]|uniref:BTB/POZ domain-containing protein At3g49900-like n=1 Tax=Salvia splendens TaxID=180675 RepID=UPI001C25EAD0|nr:BTB/POZ domain-containing protein At3g49900-like [Salvia splendens]